VDPTTTAGGNLAPVFTTLTLLVALSVLGSLWVAQRRLARPALPLVAVAALATAAWMAATYLLAQTGVLARFELRPPPFVGLALTVGLLGPVLAWSVAGTTLAEGLPLAWLVGLQAFRLPLELVMHQAYERGLMPVQMSFSGNNFDIVTGIGAAMLAVTLAFRPVPPWVVWAWNLLGLGLLANIVVIAVVSTPLIQAFGPGRLNTWVAHPPYVWLPAVMVLVAWSGHLVIWRALRAR
jgi:hypothetical protein